MKQTSYIFLHLFVFSFVSAQQPLNYQPSAIYEALQKLNFLGSALYVAAHPDDENTRLIAYLSHQVKARTSYLSLTRGDGGQNLIGTELRELLGVLRTQELLAARRIDGGEQLFTRANDFGFSKNPEETFAIWNKEQVLADVVQAIRTFKPDILINRFNHRTSGTTHGHHTASALLSVEAFDKAADSQAYPVTAQSPSAWQPARLFFNTSWWFYGSEENFAKANKTNFLNIDTGVYYPWNGLSNNEIAAQSSSQHRSQGFGRLRTRGAESEYLEFIKGKPLTDVRDPFEGINTTWTRVKGGKAIGNILYQVEKNFNFTDPSVHLPALTNAYRLIQALEDEHWRILKSEEIKEIIVACAGLYLEAVANTPSASPGETVSLQIEAINRSLADIHLKTITAVPSKTEINPNEALSANVRKRYSLNPTLPAAEPYTTPYWLWEEGEVGMYSVNRPEWIGKSETPRSFQVIFYLTVNGIDIPIRREVVHKYAEPSKGEIYQPFEVLPPVTASISHKIRLFTYTVSRDISVTLRAGKPNVQGDVTLIHPDGWRISPERIPFSIAQKGAEETVTFTVTPPTKPSEGYVRAIVHSDGKTYHQKLVTIEYDHIPKQAVLLPSTTKLVRMNLQKTGERIGYVTGVGDEVPECLREMGYQVTLLDPKEISTAVLQRFDAVVMGIRAYNVVDELPRKQASLLEYVSNGGTLVVQYNTAGRNGLLVDNMAPYKLVLSDDRVTDEQAEVRFLARDHSLLNFPNKIEKSDFDGWVQERGLYFPAAWGDEFTPILSMNDVGETPKNGSLLVAPYGKGYYIYTGLSFFRELPAGVPGAYKLFANLLSIGKPVVRKDEFLKK